MERMHSTKPFQKHTRTWFLQPHSAAPAAISFTKPEAVKPGLEMLKQMLGSWESPDCPHCGWAGPWAVLQSLIKGATWGTGSPCVQCTGPPASPWLTTKGFSQPHGAWHPTFSRCRPLGICNAALQERNHCKPLSCRRILTQFILFKMGFSKLSSCSNTKWSPQSFCAKTTWENKMPSLLRAAVEAWNNHRSERSETNRKRAARLVGVQNASGQHSQAYGVIFGWSCAEAGVGLKDHYETLRFYEGWVPFWKDVSLELLLTMHMASACSYWHFLPLQWNECCCHQPAHKCMQPCRTSEAPAPHRALAAAGFSRALARSPPLLLGNGSSMEWLVLFFPFSLTAATLPNLLSSKSLSCLHMKNELAPKFFLLKNLELTKWHQIPIAKNMKSRHIPVFGSYPSWQDTYLSPMSSHLAAICSSVMPACC